MIRYINYQFIILQVVGIVMVLLGHKGGLSLFTDWFPPYSFHMPLFIFISGYFYKQNSDLNMFDYIKKKTKKLLIPFFIWNLVYGVIVNILKYKGIVYFGSDITLKNLFIEPWISGHQFSLNIASWFVLSLFLIQILNVFLRRLFRILKLRNEYVITMIFFFMGIVGVVSANKGYISGWNLTIVRTLFLMTFFQFGYLYKMKLESIDKINNYIYFIGLFLVQFLLIKKYGELSFSAVWCNNFNKDNILLPFISSLTGIMFWLRISRILVLSIGESKVINYIGSNTWSVMMHHQFVFFIINYIFALLGEIVGLQAFNYEAFKGDSWYAYVPGNGLFLIFYVIAGIAIPLIVKFYLTKIKDILRYKMKME